MLRQQTWRPRITRFLAPTHTTCRPQDRSRCRLPSNERGLSNVLFTNCDRDVIIINPTNESRPMHRPNLIRTSFSRWKHTSVSRTLEPWIDPRSLPNSLEAHREANRDGYARDGVPVRSSKPRRRKPPDTSLKNGPRVGMNVLHLKIPKSRQKPDGQYDGVCPPLLTEWCFQQLLPRSLKFPWLSMLCLQKNDSVFHSTLEQLNAEVRAWEAYFLPSQTERQAAVNAFADVKRVLCQVSTPNTRIDLIGSRAAGTDCPTSDLDININLQSDLSLDDPEKSSRKRLGKLYRRMFQQAFRNVVLPHAYIEWARVPVIVGTHLPTGLEFQIQSRNSAYDSLEVAKAFIAEYPSARALFMLVKQMLSIRGLMNGAHGGITSYPLLNMVITSLKMAGASIADDDVGRQLLHFLDFWSEFSFGQHKIVMTSTSHEDANHRHVSISIDPISSIPKIVPKEAKELQTNYKMSMQDPADPFNDLGRNTYGIKSVQACFIMARYSINRSLSEWGSLSNQKDRERQPLLGEILGGDYTSFEEARWQLRKFQERKV